MSNQGSPMECILSESQVQGFVCHMLKCSQGVSVLP